MKRHLPPAEDMIGLGSVGGSAERERVPTRVVYSQRWGLVRT